MSHLISASANAIVQKLHITLLLIQLDLQGFNFIL